MAKASKKTVERRAAQLALGFEDRPVLRSTKPPGIPSIEVMREAILGVWLEVRLYVTPRQFLQKLRGHERDAIQRSWRLNEARARSYAGSDRAFVRHLAEHPEVYGASTAEMSERFSQLVRAHEKTAERWAGYLEWVRRNPLPAAVVSYDPTVGATLAPEDTVARDSDMTWAGTPRSALPRKYWAADRLRAVR